MRCIRLFHWHLSKESLYYVGCVSENIRKQECIPVRCVPYAAVTVLGGVSAQGVYLPRGVSAQEGVCLPICCLPRGSFCHGGCLSGGGVCLRGCVCPGMCTPSPCGQTHTCENITFPQLLLRTVNIRVPSV